ncbi:MAG: hypothetical protein K0S65_3944, partial [Labilithrix sp.]|nr:hypothetical protein [Labilithrix sp.]
MNRSREPLLLVLFLVACSSSEGGSPAPAGDAGPPECTEGTPGCIGWVSCPPEFEKVDEGGCREILPT